MGFVHTRRLMNIKTGQMLFHSNLRNPIGMATIPDAQIARRQSLEPIPKPDIKHLIDGSIFQKPCFFGICDERVTCNCSYE
jgi:hypothetical protein